MAVLTARYAFVSVVAGVGEPEQPCELLVGLQRDQVSAAVDPVGQRGHLDRRQRDVAEDDDVELAEDCGRHERDVERRERVQAFVAQDLRRIHPELVAVEPMTSTGGGTIRS